MALAEAARAEVAQARRDHVDQVRIAPNVIAKMASEANVLMDPVVRDVDHQHVANAPTWMVPIAIGHLPETARAPVAICIVVTCIVARKIMMVTAAKVLTPTDLAVPRGPDPPAAAAVRDADFRVMDQAAAGVARRAPVFHAADGDHGPDAWEARAVAALPSCRGLAAAAVVGVAGVDALEADLVRPLAVTVGRRK